MNNTAMFYTDGQPGIRLLSGNELDLVSGGGFDARKWVSGAIGVGAGAAAGYAAQAYLAAGGAIALGMGGAAAAAIIGFGVAGVVGYGVYYLLC